MPKSFVALALMASTLPALADNKVGDAAQPFHPPRELAGRWKESGTYDLKSAGIRIHVKPGQQILLLDDNPLSIYRRCRSQIQAIVHDPKLGLALVGRFNADHAVTGEWDSLSTSMFPQMIKWYRERQASGWVRLPLRSADFYSPPIYDPSAYRARWVFSFAKDDATWFSSYWFAFDREGFVVVALLSNGPGIDGLDAAIDKTLQPPILVENLQPHPVPLASSDDSRDFTAAFLAIMAEPVIGTCQSQTPFGDSY